MATSWTRFRRDKTAIAGLAVIALIVAAAALAPWLAPFDPSFQAVDGLTDDGSPVPPNGEFWLGTDLLGRDLLSRMIFGARNSPTIGLVANGAAVLIGTTLGVVAGYLGGYVGATLMRLTDMVTAFPALLLAVALAAILGSSLWIVAAVIAMVNWVQIARVIYTETTALSSRDYIEAARALGAGAQPPDPSWGGIIVESQSYFLSAPWLVFFPGIAIILVALAFNLVGDALRDALDPTQRGRG